MRRRRRRRDDGWRHDADGHRQRSGRRQHPRRAHPARPPSRTRFIVKDEGGAGLLGSTGEFLSFSNAKLELEPRIAESWEPNEDGTVWTFKIRQGVTFHSGATLVANDVKTTFDKLINPDGGSANALSALGGVLSPGGIEAPDDATVVFNLDAAERQLPHPRQLGELQRDHHPGRPRPRRLGEDVRGHRALQARQLLAEGRREVRAQRRLLGHEGEPGLDGAQVLRRRGADDRRHPGRRGRLRRALLRLGRQGAPGRPERHGDRGRRPRRIASSTCGRTRIRSRTSASARRSRSRSTARRSWTGLWEGQADLGNDSPFAPLYPSTDTSVPQREQNIDQAKQLLADAGMGDGFTVDLSTWNGFEIPDLAQLVKQYAAEIGVTINLKITDARHVLRRRRLREVDLARLRHGHHRLRPPAGAERLPHGRLLGQRRSASGTRLTSRTTSTTASSSSTWRHWTSTRRRRVSKQIEELLLDETPIVFPYFYYFLSGREEEPAQRGLSRHRPVRPLEGRLHQLTNDESRRPGLWLRPPNP